MSEHIDEGQAPTQKLDSHEIPVNPTDLLVQDALNKAVPQTEGQQLFQAYQDSLNRFITLVSNYAGSKKQLQRVMVNLAISPMNAEELYFDPAYPEEREVFELGNEVNSTKMFLMLQNMVDGGKVIMVEEESSKSSTSSEETIVMEKE